MNQSPINQQREAEAKKLKQILAVGLVGSILLHLIGFLLFGLSRTVWSRVPEETEELIELTAVDPQNTISADDTESTGGGGGGGSSQFSLSNPNPGEPDAINTVIPSAPSSSPQTVTAPAPPEEPKQTEPSTIPTRTPSSSVLPTPTSAASPPLNPSPTPSPSVLPTPISAASSLQQSVSPRPSASTTPSLFVKASDSDKKGQSASADAAQGLNQKTRGSTVSGKGTSGTSLGSGSGKGNGTGSGIGPGIGKGQGGGIGTGTGNGVGVGKGNGTGSGTKNRLKAIQSAPSPVSPPVQVPQATEKLSPSGQRKPKCLKNCGLDRYLGAEGSARFEFDVDASGKVINVKLKQSSGNAEVDQKAEAAVRKRKYEASDSGFSSKIRVTSEQEGSDFQRQQLERRRKNAVLQAEQERRAAEQAQIEQEQNRQNIIQPPATPKPLPTEPKPAQPESITEPSPVLLDRPPPVPEPVTVPSIPEPVYQAPSVPEPPAPAPVSEPVAEPVLEPPPPEPIAEPLLEPAIDPAPVIAPSAP